jgi:hypothetical protein
MHSDAEKSSYGTSSHMRELCRQMSSYRGHSTVDELILNAIVYLGNDFYMDLCVRNEKATSKLHVIARESGIILVWVHFSLLHLA